MTIDFWCELASTYTYLSAHRIEPLAATAGVEVRWRPFTLGPIFKAAGWHTSPFAIYPAKGRYMWRDVEREAARLGLPWRRPTVFPRNSVPAAKIALALGAEAPRFIQRVLRANFVDDQDIAAPDVLASLLAELGLAATMNAGALRRSTEEAMRLGVFGAPTFIVGDEMFWGNDRLEQAIEWARNAR